MLPKPLWLAAFAFALVAASCSSPNPLLSISGKVTLDGAPLPAGDILFTPADPQFGGEAAKIETGSYQAAVRPGQNKVQIRATRAVPGNQGPMGEPLLEDIIPAKYNDQSTLTIDVSKTQLQHDFSLQSK